MRFEVWISGLSLVRLVNILYRRLSSAANRFSSFPQTSTSSLFQLFQEAFHILHLFLEKPISQCRIASPRLSLTLNQVLWDRSEALIFWQSLLAVYPATYECKLWSDLLLWRRVANKGILRAKWRLDEPKFSNSAESSWTCQGSTIYVYSIPAGLL